MTPQSPVNSPVNLAIVVQSGRLAYEALLLAASLRRTAQIRDIRLIALEPAPGPLWPTDPRLPDGALRDTLKNLGCTFQSFDSQHFGATYPHGNKIEGLRALPQDEPFLFLDTDTLILGDLGKVPFDFDRPTASLRREDSWPNPQPDGPTRHAIWQSLYDQASLDMTATLDPDWPDTDWRHYLYFNAGFFFYRCPHRFGATYLRHALAIRDAPPNALANQSLDPWLDQIALPLTVHALGGGRDTLPPGLMDGQITCHWRRLPLAFARESDAVIDMLHALAADPDLAPLLRAYPPFARFLYGPDGPRARTFHNTPAPDERTLRQALRAADLWDSDR